MHRSRAAAAFQHPVQASPGAQQPQQPMHLHRSHLHDLLIPSIKSACRWKYRRSADALQQPLQQPLREQQCTNECRVIDCHGD